MIPLGFMLKSIALRAPEWMGAPYVESVRSVSGCVSSNFGDYIDLWKHNGWWLFDTPEAVCDAAASLGVATDGLSLFYYEAFEQQYDAERNEWQPFSPDPDLPTTVIPPAAASLSGFDVVTFWAGHAPECSPLSCNGLAASLRVNTRCLFDNFDEARAAVGRGAFKD